MLCSYPVRPVISSNKFFSMKKGRRFYFSLVFNYLRQTHVQSHVFRTIHRLQQLYFPMFLHALPQGRTHEQRYLNFFRRPELCPNTCRNVIANFILLPENTQPSWHDLSLMYTVSAAGKSIQSTLLARKTIMITQMALSWSTVAILSSSVGDN